MTTDALRLLELESVAPPTGRDVEGRPADDRSALPDETLLARTTAGDADAFRVLVARYEPRLRHFVLWYAGERHAMEDVVQEIFLQAFRSAPSYRGESSVKTWLYAIARNVCRNHCRDRVQHEVPIDNDLLERMPNVGIDPLAMLQRDEKIATVRAAIGTLPADARLVLTLRDWEQLSYAEIADVLEVPIGTVRSRLHNARARLASVLVNRGFPQ